MRRETGTLGQDLHRYWRTSAYSAMPARRVREDTFDGARDDANLRLRVGRRRVSSGGRLGGGAARDWLASGPDVTRRWAASHVAINGNERASRTEGRWRVAGGPREGGQDAVGTSARRNWTLVAPSEVLIEFPNLEALVLLQPITRRVLQDAAAEHALCSSPQWNRP